MIYDLEKSPVPAGNFDVCIVGAGAAGLYLTTHFLAQGKRVLLLEGGGEKRFERRSQALNKSEIVGLPFAGAHCGRFRNIGGSTATWAGQIMELDDIDFEHREWVPGSGWPFRKSILLPYYRQARAFEGIADSYLDDHEFLKVRGFDMPDFGGDLQFAYSRYCPVLEFASLCETALNTHPNLVTYVHANAVGLDFADDAETIKAVRCRTVTGKEATFTANRFVLCMGGIESSRFLLQATNMSTPPWNKSGYVGRHFQDHAHCFTADIVDVDINAPHWHYGPNRVYHEKHSYLPKIKLSPAAQERLGVLNVSGFAEYEDGLYPAMRTAILLVTGPMSAITARDLAYTVPRAPMVVYNYVRRKLDPTYALPTVKLKLSVITEQSPQSASRITLSDKKDAVGLYQARIDWRVSAQEITTVRRYTEIVKDEFERRGLARIILDPDLYHNEKIAKKFSDTFHHMGGTRMANYAVDGVVDPNLRLFGTRNVYVCSTSVFPASGFANPTHTLLALAGRLAAYLKDS